MDQIIFIDIETTGLDPAYHEIIEIAIIGKNIRYHEKIKPLHLERADPSALARNGFTSKEWRSAIHPRAAVQKISDLIQGKTIVGHNPTFDMSFLDELFHQYNILVHYDIRLIDTVTLAHEHLAPCGLEKMSLDSIRQFFGWTKVGSHTAMKDCEDTKKLYELLIRAGSFKRFVWTHRKKVRALLRFLCSKKHHI